MKMEKCCVILGEEKESSKPYMRFCCELRWERCNETSPKTEMGEIRDEDDIGK
ncbi:MAG: hypothetical protein IJ439_06345 [Tyzzerella sp.]|nr:hypothetical protein [Tyzzerella sp.]